MPLVFRFEINGDRSTSKYKVWPAYLKKHILESCQINFHALHKYLNKVMKTTSSSREILTRICILYTYQTPAILSFQIKNDKFIDFL